jgi:alkylhydroperoxidase family enzyme
VALVADSYVSHAVYEEARKHFSEKDLVDLTLVIISINQHQRLELLE